jgi:ABC-2 type transport system permease protein
MRHVPALLARELGAYFSGPLAYLILLAIQVLAFSNFFALLVSLTGGPVLQAGLADPMNTYIAFSVQFWVTILFAIPALTMRLLAEEKRMGTIEPLLTAPVTEGEVVVAKWLAGLAMYLALLIPFGIYLPFLHAHYPFDLGPIASLLIGLITLGMLFVSIGVFFSATTKSQVAAGIWTFAVLFLLILSGAALAGMAGARRSEWAEGLLFLSPLAQADAFGRGQLDPRHLALHLSGTVVMLFLATSVLKSRREA